MKLCIYTSIGSAHVVVEGFDGFLFQLRGGATDRHQVYKEEEYARGNAAANPETSYHLGLPYRGFKAYLHNVLRPSPPSRATLQRNIRVALIKPYSLALVERQDFLTPR